MNISIKYLYFLLLLILGSYLLPSCNEPEEEGIFIEEALQEYFDRFQEEAAIRGIEVNYDSAGISGYLGSIPDQGVIGQCVRSNGAVTVDKQFWIGFDDLTREFVIFHELGHCFLKRDHCDKILEGEICHSIMASSQDLCDSNYDLTTREGYIDELFDTAFLAGCN